MIKPNGQSWLDSRLLLLLLAANYSPSIPSDASNLIEANTANPKEHFVDVDELDSRELPEFWGPDAIPHLSSPPRETTEARISMGTNTGTDEPLG